MPRRANATSYGGKLGNPQGRGPKPGMGGANPATLRLKMRNALARQIDTLESIANGTLTTTVVVRVGEARYPVEVGPAINERRAAIDTLAKYGVGTADAVDVTSGGEKLVRVLRDDPSAIPPAVAARAAASNGASEPG